MSLAVFSFQITTAPKGKRFRQTSKNIVLEDEPETTLTLVNPSVVGLDRLHDRIMVAISYIVRGLHLRYVDV